MNRTSFDLVKAESELASGFNTTHIHQYTKIIETSQEEAQNFPRKFSDRRHKGEGTPTEGGKGGEEEPSKVHGDVRARAQCTNKRSARSAHRLVAVQAHKQNGRVLLECQSGILVFFARAPQNMYARGLHVNGGTGRGSSTSHQPGYRSLFSHPVVSTGR